MLHTTTEQCACCGKWKIVGIQEVSHGFIPDQGATNLTLLWDTAKKLCPDCNQSGIFGPRQPDDAERFAVRHWWSGLPVIERGGFYASSSFV